MVLSSSTWHLKTMCYITDAGLGPSLKSTVSLKLAHVGAKFVYTAPLLNMEM